MKPKASYVLSLDKRKGVCEWAQQLTMPDAYCSNFGNCVDMKAAKFQNMKSHDCHVFLQTLMPIAFRALPDDVLEPLVELSEYFKNICSPVLRVDKLKKMKRNKSTIFCNWERLFPPGFFNVMEHLPVHLAEEAYLGGPVQYRWMYPFKR